MKEMVFNSWFLNLPPQLRCSSLLSLRGTVNLSLHFNSSAFVKRRCHAVTEEMVFNSRFFQSPSPFGYSLLSLRGRVFWSAPACARFVGTRHAVSACCVIELPPQLRCSSLLPQEGQFLIWYSLKLLRFCKEEVSRSDGGDSSQFAFFSISLPLRVLPLRLKRESFFVCFNLLSRFAPAPLGL